MTKTQIVGATGLYARYSVDEHPDRRDFHIHAHEDCELYYFVSGRGIYSVEGHEYRLSPGSVMLMRIGETHMMHIEPEVPYERYVINFVPDLLSAIDPAGLLMEPYLHRSVGTKNLYTPSQINSPLIRSCFEGMLASRNRDSYTQRVVTLSNLTAILCEISRAFHSYNILPAPVAPQGLIATVVEYINRNLTEDLSLDTLSARFYLSKSYLNQQFRQATGTTIWDYVLLKRLMLARTSIRSGSSVTDAFQASGFNDYSSFYRRYKSRFGVSPKDDRPRSEN